MLVGPRRVVVALTQHHAAVEGEAQITVLGNHAQKRQSGGVDGVVNGGVHGFEHLFLYPVDHQMNTAGGEVTQLRHGALGIAQGAIDEAVKYVKERVQFGRPISKFQNTQFTLADMQTKVDAARLLVYRAAAKKDAGEPYSAEAAMAKLFASETASDVTRRAVQLFGGYGYTRDYPVERMMRDAKITEIYEGTSEVQKMVISASMGLK